MFVLIGKDGPVVALSKLSDAEQWSTKFGWTIAECVNGDGKEPIRLRTGYMSLLEPAKPAVFTGQIISFVPEEQASFPNPDNVNIGDLFHRTNLENMFFAVPEDANVNDMAIEFWKKLHQRGLDLKRQADGRFRIAKVEFESESPVGTHTSGPASASINGIASTLGVNQQVTATVQGGDPRLKLPTETDPPVG